MTSWSRLWSWCAKAAHLRSVNSSFAVSLLWCSRASRTSSLAGSPCSWYASSDFVLADVSVRSPGKLFICIMHNKTRDQSFPNIVYLTLKTKWPCASDMQRYAVPLEQAKYVLSNSLETLNSFRAVDWSVTFGPTLPFPQSEYVLSNSLGTLNNFRVADWSITFRRTQLFPLSLFQLWRILLCHECLCAIWHFR